MIAFALHFAFFALAKNLCLAIFGHDQIQIRISGLPYTHNTRLALISSGLDVLSEWVEEKYGFDYGVSNRLLHDDGILTGEVEIKVHYDRKAEWVRNIMDMFGVRNDEIIAIGDSAGDMEMFEMAGFSISFNSSSPRLDRIADVVIKGNDLSEVITTLPATIRHKSGD